MCYSRYSSTGRPTLVRKTFEREGIAPLFSSRIIFSTRYSGKNVVAGLTPLSSCVATWFFQSSNASKSMPRTVMPEGLRSINFPKNLCWGDTRFMTTIDPIFIKRQFLFHSPDCSFDHQSWFRQSLNILQSHTVAQLPYYQAALGDLDKA